MISYIWHQTIRTVVIFVAFNVRNEFHVEILDTFKDYGHTTLTFLVGMVHYLRLRNWELYIHLTQKLI
jgi:hypothetical protein